jgi:TPR repeat protein
MYEKGYGCEKNQATANYLFSTAAEKGSAQGQYNLAASYQYGLDLKKDIDIAIHFYCLAANQKHAGAIRQLGQICELESPQDMVRAAQFYTQAAELGDTIAEFNLGTCYQFGTGVTKNIAKSAMYYSRAADKKDRSAIFNLGILYQEGIDGNVDYIKAMSCFERAAELGHLKVACCIGFLWLEGLGVNKDIDKALDFFETGALSGEVNAQYHLGLLYKRDSEIPHDLNKTLYWLKKAALQDFAPAQVALGVMLINGEGTEVNAVEGFKWICIGHANGEEHAENLVSYCREVIPLDITEEGYKQAQCVKTKNIPITYGATSLIH